MSPSGCLCLLSTICFILPTRGQRLEETTSIPRMEPSTMDSHVLTQVPDTAHPELQSAPQSSTQKTGETTQSQANTQTQKLKGTDELTTGALTATDTRGRGGTTLSERRSPGKESRRGSSTPRQAGSGEVMEDPFFYDEDALRKRGLLVAAVLFIMGIIILTSGKCRRLSQLCPNYCR